MPDHARGGPAGRVPETPEAAEFLRRRDRRGARAPRGTGLPCRHTEPVVCRTRGRDHSSTRIRSIIVGESASRVWRVCVASSSTSIETISVNSGTRNESQIIVVVPVIGGIRADQALDITCEYQYRKPLQTSTMHRDNTVPAKCLACQLGVRGCML